MMAKIRMSHYLVGGNKASPLGRETDWKLMPANSSSSFWVHSWLHLSWPKSIITTPGPNQTLLVCDSQCQFTLTALWRSYFALGIKRVVVCLRCEKPQGPLQTPDDFSGSFAEWDKCPKAWRPTRGEKSAYPDSEERRSFFRPHRVARGILVP